MPPSQLKRLKASLRDKGVTGPQQSKKERKRDAANPDARNQRAAALESIREAFNPFEVKTLARPKKFDVTTSRPQNAKAATGLVGRPGVSKSMGEEAVRSDPEPPSDRRPC